MTITLPPVSVHPLTAPAQASAPGSQGMHFSNGRTRSRVKKHFQKEVNLIHETTFVQMERLRALAKRSDNYLEAVLHARHPDVRLHRIAQLTPSLVKLHGWKGLIFDMDDTLKPMGKSFIESDILERLRDLRANGIHIGIVSNNPFDGHLKRLREWLLKSDLDALEPLLARRNLPEATLEHLRASLYKAIGTNTSLDSLVEGLRQANLKPDDLAMAKDFFATRGLAYTPIRFDSRKPFKSAFESVKADIETMAHCPLKPKDVAVVGDGRVNDIIGGKLLGMGTIQCTWYNAHFSGRVRATVLDTISLFVNPIYRRYGVPFMESFRASQTS